MLLLLLVFIVIIIIIIMNNVFSSKELSYHKFNRERRCCKIKDIMKLGGNGFEIKRSAINLIKAGHGRFFFLSSHHFKCLFPSWTPLPRLTSWLCIKASTPTPISTPAMMTNRMANYKKTFQWKQVIQYQTMSYSFKHIFRTIVSSQTF